MDVRETGMEFAYAGVRVEVGEWAPRGWDFVIAC